MNNAEETATEGGQIEFLPPVTVNLKHAITRRALELGFDLVGFAAAEPFPATQRVLEERIDAGLLSGLTWFSKERAAIAGDAHNLMPDVRTIMSLGISYLGEGEFRPSEPGDPRGRVARYAWGLDYHVVFREKLDALHSFIQDSVGRPVDYRALSDTARIVDRAAAQRAGLGWYGKNSNVLNRDRGSWILLGELLLNISLPPDEAVRTHCGACTRCMPACPTSAIVAPGVIDNNRCISYLTIELRGPIPRELRPLIGDWIFGCDICQDACPVNLKAKPADHPEFSPSAGIGPSPSLTDVLEMTEDDFKLRFRRSPVKRAKWSGLRRNAAVALGNVGDHSAVPALVRALNGEPPLVRGHAAWALGRLAGPEALDGLLDRRGVEQDEWVIEEIDLAVAALRTTREKEPENGS